jgi:hypothetical protein
MASEAEPTEPTGDASDNLPALSAKKKQKKTNFKTHISNGNRIKSNASFRSENYYYCDRPFFLLSGIEKHKNRK